VLKKALILFLLSLFLVSPISSNAENNKIEMTFKFKGKGDDRDLLGISQIGKTTCYFDRSDRNEEYNSDLDETTYKLNVSFHQYQDPKCDVFIGGGEALYTYEITPDDANKEIFLSNDSHGTLKYTIEGYGDGGYKKIIIYPLDNNGEVMHSYLNEPSYSTKYSTAIQWIHRSDDDVKLPPGNYKVIIDVKSKKWEEGRSDRFIFIKKIKIEPNVSQAISFKKEEMSKIEFDYSNLEGLEEEPHKRVIVLKDEGVAYEIVNPFFLSAQNWDDEPQTFYFSKGVYDSLEIWKRYFYQIKNFDTRDDTTTIVIPIGIDLDSLPIDGHGSVINWPGDETYEYEAKEESKPKNEISVVINGQVQQYDQPPIIKDGRTLVPLRGVFEALGATVEWDPKHQTIQSLKRSTAIVLHVGSKDAFIDDPSSGINKSVRLDVAPEIINGRTFVPIRFISEYMGADVNWDGINKIITIKTP
jgi:hypothetical protein